MLMQRSLAKLVWKRQGLLHSVTSRRQMLQRQALVRKLKQTRFHRLLQRSHAAIGFQECKTLLQIHLIGGHSA